jgi:hypothetical protein
MGPVIHAETHRFSYINLCIFCYLARSTRERIIFGVKQFNFRPAPARSKYPIG